VVFEADEQLRPGQDASWNIRLRNVGTVDWMVTNMSLAIVQTSDPGPQCPTSVLAPWRFPNSFSSTDGVHVIGKNGDPFNDNPLPPPNGIPGFAASTTERVAIRVAPGDFEDVRLRVALGGSGVENCDGSQWNVTFTFTVG
jgi:hypothetical protein